MQGSFSCFISHAWGSEAENKFTDRLNKHLKLSNIRTYYDRDLPPGSNLVRFMSNIDKADYVISVYTPTYKERAEGEENSGVAREWGAIYDILSSRKFIPILHVGEHKNSVPVLARSILYRSFADDTKYYENVFDILSHMLPSQGNEISLFRISFSQNKPQAMPQSARRIEPPTAQMAQMVITPAAEGKSNSRPSSSQPRVDQKPSSAALESKPSSIVRTEAKPSSTSVSITTSVERPMSTPIPEIARGFEDIYRRFIGGKLIYKPNKDNDVGRIELPFSVLSNPLEGVFDLSRCGDVGNYLSIATGYRKGQKAENKDKTEVWIVPKFVVEKNLSSSAKHLAPITDKFTSPVGIFWTYGNWDNSSRQMGWYDYLTVQNFDELSNGENLYEKWSHGMRGG